MLVIAFSVDENLARMHDFELTDSIPVVDPDGAWSVVDEFTRRADGKRLYKHGDDQVRVADDSTFVVVRTGLVLHRMRTQ